MNMKAIQDNVAKLNLSFGGGDYNTLKKQICNALIIEIITAHKNGEFDVHDYPVMHSLIEASHIADIVQGEMIFEDYKRLTANQPYGCECDYTNDEGSGDKPEQGMQDTPYFKG